MEVKTIDKRYNKFIALVSVAIPLVVIALFTIKLRDFGFDVKPLSFLPPIYAVINALTAVVLIGAVLSIKNGNRILHERLMTVAIALSVAFLLMYVAYHMTSDSTKFGDSNHDGLLDLEEKTQVGYWRGIYFFILITHIILSVAVIPLVLISYVRALDAKFDQHKKIAKITFPVWLYVAVTGVIVYWLISPYYA